jgi:enoyl-CoA hydratase
VAGVSDEPSTVTLSLDGDVAVIRLDDGKANALGHRALDDLDAALDRAEAEALAVVVVGREGRFSAGFDLATMTAGMDSALPLLEKGAATAIRLLTFPLPVVLACTGHALAMGAIVLMSGDVRIGADGPFKVGMNEVAIGMPVPRFAVELAHERLSPRHFPSAIGLARIYDPAGAVAAGYLDRVVPADRVEAEAVEEAATLAATLRSGAFRMTRRIMRDDLAEALRRGIARDLEDFTVEA